MKPLHIFRAGRHTASCGTALDFDESTLEASAAVYDPKLHEAPIVVGHPKDNGPAFGWIRGLSFREGDLTAEPHQLNADFEALVQQGAYKKISASFYAPDAPQNPSPGTWYLRHVGFLGAQPPAVKGLDPVAFGEDEDGIVQFAEPLPAHVSFGQLARIVRNLREFLLDKFDRQQANEVVPDYLVEELEERARQPMPPSTTDTDFREAPAAAQPAAAPAPPDPEDTAMNPEQQAQAEADLAAREAAVDSREASFTERETRLAAAEQAQATLAIGRRLDELIQAGKVLPADKERLLNFMSALDQTQTVSFAEGEGATTQSARDCLFDYLTAQPARVDFGEHSRGEPPSSDPEDPGALANAAIAYQEAQARSGLDISITQAVTDVVAGKHAA